MFCVPLLAERLSIFRDHCVDMNPMRVIAIAVAMAGISIGALYKYQGKLLYQNSVRFVVGMILLIDRSGKKRFFRIEISVKWRKKKERETFRSRCAWNVSKIVLESSCIKALYIYFIVWRNLAIYVICFQFNERMLVISLHWIQVISLPCFVNTHPCLVSWIHILALFRDYIPYPCLVSWPRGYMYMPLPCFVK